MTDPFAVFVLGPAGTGKSTYARRLSAATGTAYLDKDRLVEPLTTLLLRQLGVDPLQRESSPVYLDEVFPAEYQALLGVAADILSVGCSVVVDAPFFDHLENPAYLASARIEAGWPPARVVVVELTSSPDTARARIAARSLPRDRWKLAHWQDYLKLVSERRCRWTDATIVSVDANPTEPSLEPVMDVLATR
ncbi:MAG: AAA family ATPase [Nostocoides sp.]